MYFLHIYIQLQKLKVTTTSNLQVSYEVVVKEGPLITQIKSRKRSIIQCSYFLLYSLYLYSLSFKSYPFRVQCVVCYYVGIYDFMVLFSCCSQICLQFYNWVILATSPPRLSLEKWPHFNSFSGVVSSASLNSEMCHNAMGLK